MSLGSTIAYYTKRFFDVLYTLAFGLVAGGVVSVLSVKSGALSVFVGWCVAGAIGVTASIFCAYSAKAGKEARSVCAFMAAAVLVLFLLTINFTNIDQERYWFVSFG